MRGAHERVWVMRSGSEPIPTDTRDAHDRSLSYLNALAEGLVRSRTVTVARVNLSTLGTHANEPAVSVRDVRSA